MRRYLFLIVVIVACAVILGVATARAHGPWPYDCCHENDCEEIAKEWVRERGGLITFTVPPGGHKMWPADGRPAFVVTVERKDLRKPVTGEWSICISPAGKLLCAFPPDQGF